MTEVHAVLKWSMHQPVIDFQIPVGSRVIEVAGQDDVPCIWTVGPAGGPTETRTFIGYGTGHPILEENLKYVGTAHGIEGSLVFHIFERLNLD